MLPQEVAEAVFVEIGFQRRHDKRPSLTLAASCRVCGMSAGRRTERELERSAIPQRQCDLIIGQAFVAKSARAYRLPLSCNLAPLTARAGKIEQVGYIGRQRA